MLKLSQILYAEQILERFRKTESKPVMTPMEAQRTNMKLVGDKVDESMYSKAVGRFMYLTICTRQDTLFVTVRLSHHMQIPTE